MERLEVMAGLWLSEEERETLNTDMHRILACFRELRCLDVEGLAPSVPPSQEEGSCRADEVTPSLSQDQSLEFAPRVLRGYFAVPVSRGCQLKNW